MMNDDCEFEIAHVCMQDFFMSKQQNIILSYVASPLKKTFKLATNARGTSLETQRHAKKQKGNHSDIIPCNMIIWYVEVRGTHYDNSHIVCDV